MRVLHQELQPAGGVQHARAHTHGREAAQLSPLRQVVHQENVAQTAPAHTYR